MTQSIIQIIVYSSFFMIGTLVGSFISLAIHRLPMKEDIVFKRSYCPNCDHELGFFDLIPVLSYIFLRGKCRYCGMKIKLRYFLLELLNGIWFMLVVMLTQSTVKSAVILIAYTSISVLVGSYLNEQENKKQFLEKNSQILKPDISTNEEENQKDTNINKVENEKDTNNITGNNGYINVELAIASVITVTLVFTIVFLIYNSNIQLNQIKKYSGALELAINELENVQLASYDDVTSYIAEDVEFDGNKYKKELKVSKYSEQDAGKEDVLKTVEVIVSYRLGSDISEVSLKTLRALRGE